MTTVDTRHDGRVLIAEMSRPDALNAFSTELMDDLADVFLAAAGDDAVSVLVLTGAGRAFSAGADLKEMAQAGRPDPRHGWPGLLTAMIEFPKPFIVAINGVGAGVGATIAGLADLVLIAEGARLRCPFSELGLTAEAGSTLTFPRLMGRQRALWFLWSSEWWTAEECVEAGLALELCAPGDLMARTMEYATKLAALPVASLVTTKELVVGAERDALRAATQRENAALARLIGGPANREALAAFAERRPPNFDDLA